MFSNFIYNNYPPNLNVFPSNKDAYSKNYSIVSDDSSAFENILSKMKFSKIKKTFGCSNINCKVAFPILSPCNFCNKNFCDKCKIKCHSCEKLYCKFCLSIQYEKFEDIYLCPNCLDSYK